jgi:4-hydroxy-tetrahydrodipicolinate synthase
LILEKGFMIANITTKKLVGMGVALVTPFTADGSVDFDALGRLVEYQIKNKADYLVILGTTAETPTLLEQEKEAIKSFIVERVAGRVPLVLGVGGNCTASVVEQAKNVDPRTFSAILSVTPYYNKPSQEGIYQHYKAVAESSSVPVILYNVPGRTGVNMTAQTTLRLAREFDNIVAIKEASGNITQMDEIIENKPENFVVISGDDGVTFPLITLGAVGVISVIGNAFPAEFSKMVRLALNGEYESARKIHAKFNELFSLLFVDGNPAGVKSMLSMMGFIENRLRLPLVPTSIATDERMKQILDTL